MGAYNTSKGDAMSNVEKFQELLRSDEALQERLRTAATAYEGDRADEAAFDALVAPLAAEVGLPFTFEEAKAYAEEDQEVSLDDVDAVAGGEDVPSYELSGCFIIGGSDSVDADGCELDLRKMQYAGGGACAYVGVGLISWD